MLKVQYKEIARLSTLSLRMKLTGTFLIKPHWTAKTNFLSSLSQRQLKGMTSHYLRVKHSRFNLSPSKLFLSVKSRSA
jgi:hypothetical protein